MEIDEGFFDIQMPAECKGEPLKRGAGSQAKAKVLVMVESIPVVNPKNPKQAKKARHIKILVVKDLDSQTLLEAAQSRMEQESIVTSDDSTSHSKIAKWVQSYDSKVVLPVNLDTELPWVHRTIGNCKRQLEDLHNKLSPSLLQNYPDEFCYKFNRRYLREEMLDFLVSDAVCEKNTFMHRSYAA